jgi:hypothetical protein
MMNCIRDFSLGAMNVDILKKNGRKFLVIIALILFCMISGISVRAVDEASGTVDVTLYQRVDKNGATWDLSKSTMENTTGIDNTTFSIYDVTNLIHEMMRADGVTLEKASQELNARSLANNQEILTQATHILDVVTATANGVSGMATFRVTNDRSYLIVQSAASENVSTDNLILTLPIADENNQRLTQVTLYAKTTVETPGPEPTPDPTPTPTEETGVLPQTEEAQPVQAQASDPEETLPRTLELIQTGEKILASIELGGIILLLLAIFGFIFNRFRRKGVSEHG